MNKKPNFPPGWDEERAERAIKHYESQSEEETVSDDEATFGSSASLDAPELTKEEHAEPELRLREYEANPDEGAPWPEVKERS